MIIEKETCFSTNSSVIYGKNHEIMKYIDWFFGIKIPKKIDSIIVLGVENIKMSMFVSAGDLQINRWKFG
jgi:hypothetical protein